MHLLKRIAISNGNKKRKEEATTAILNQDQEQVADWNKSLEDEVWDKIVEALAARGYRKAKNDIKEKNQ
jgi:hypothetical protein